MYIYKYLAITLAFVSVISALNNGLGLTPQMGWNSNWINSYYLITYSWNYFACNINETVIMETAKAMATNGMKDAGYVYVNIDDCWAESRDKNGVIQPDSNTFPNGIAYIADYVHGLGLKLGIYTDAGTETCAGRPGSFGYEQIDAQTYASWGIDYLKEDWCNTGSNQPLSRYSIMSQALNATGRPIFFSLCDWGTDNPWEWGPTVGNSFRTTGDIKDNWASFMNNLNLQIPITSYSQVGGWNDPDMLEVGNGGMTTTEYISHFSLWSILNAPLIAGNDLRNIDQTTLSILTAPEVIAVNQDPLGKQGALVRSYNGGLQQVWAKPMADGSRVVVLFNTDSISADIQLEWVDIYVQNTATMTVRDLWARSDVGQYTGSYVSLNVPSHGCAMLKIY
ncbi:putative alpha-galactosidase [Heterostelium album PN500]|uniref:Alpha-galactosidase n=1 Tax=Heterostelium pallidum (strain ATCC 26659 / Pp 5 / PN500) TaxID=670386 RepID=D3BAB9_HETP5|nr:putative alpha-galactosidase [Heterostelium album PN500]EFA81506.1 putative alpha-galactosidase [Heterostelium album PN500]|eukprot:XP_020433623.1 putative alpha-galactosidase [Heterostelium album PN500]